MGGAPSKGTKADRRLKANRGAGGGTSKRPKGSKRPTPQKGK